MDPSHLVRAFDRIGARVSIEEAPFGTVALDVTADRRGERFDVRVNPRRVARLQAVDVRPALRHLLLLSETDDEPKAKHLCGHDERHWFTCAVPGRSVAGVTDAMAALKPASVRHREQTLGVKPRDRTRRKNAAFVRQGEWFFVPLMPHERHFVRGSVLRHEPLSRGAGSKPHVVDELIRHGGRTVYVGPEGDVLSESRLAKLRPRERRQYRLMRAQPTVYVRGKVRHADHATVTLADWHRVLMNTEGDAPWASQVVFLD